MAVLEKEKAAKTTSVRKAETIVDVMKPPSKYLAMLWSRAR
jgi:hypothetical protein